MRVGSAGRVLRQRRGTARSGITPRESCAVVRVSASTPSATCSVPARRAFSALHGIGASSDQSTFTVAVVELEAVEVGDEVARQVLLADAARGTASARSSSRARRAAPRPPRRRAAARRPPARRARARARPGAPHASSPPCARSRATSASVSRCAPPSGTGKPCCWPSPHSTQPNSAPPAESGVRSACSALPASSHAAALAAEALLRQPPHRHQREAREVAAAPSARARPRSRALPRSGGNGRSSASMNGSPACSHDP